jgi:hypothetical protein
MSDVMDVLSDIAPLAHLILSAVLIFAVRDLGRRVRDLEKQR